MDHATTSLELPSDSSADRGVDWQFDWNDLDRRDIEEELRAFVSNLRTIEFDGEPLIDFPRDFDGLVGGLVCETRLKSAGRTSWIGVQRFRDLPFSSSSVDQDREIQRGLSVIDELDETLRLRTIEQSLISRNSYQGRGQSRRDRKRRQTHLKRELKSEKERRRVLREERLKRIVGHSSDKDQIADSFYRLNPDEEKILEELMKLDEEDLMQNPFDCEVQVDNGWMDLSTSKSFSAASDLSTTDREERLGEITESKQSSLYQSLKPDYLQQIRESREYQRRLDRIDDALQEVLTRDYQDLRLSPDDFRKLLDQ